MNKNNNILVLLLIMTILIISGCDNYTLPKISSQNYTDTPKNVLNKNANNSLEKEVINLTIEKEPKEIINLTIEKEPKEIIPAEDNPECYFDTTNEEEISLNDEYKLLVNTQDNTLSFQVKEKANKRHNPMLKTISLDYQEPIEILDNIYFKIINATPKKIQAGAINHNVTLRIYNTTKKECEIDKKRENLVLLICSGMYTNPKECYIPTEENEIRNYGELIGLRIEVTPKLDIEIKDLTMKVDNSKELITYKNEYSNSWYVQVPQKSLKETSTVNVKYYDQYNREYEFSQKIYKLDNKKQIVRIKENIIIPNHGVIIEKTYDNNFELRINSKIFNVTNKDCITYHNSKEEFMFELCNTDIINSWPTKHYIFEVVRISNSLLDDNNFEPEYCYEEPETLRKGDSIKCRGTNYEYIEDYPKLNMVQFDVDQNGLHPILVGNMGSTLVITNLDSNEKEIEVKCYKFCDN